MSFYDAIRVGASGAGDYEIERSARFRGATDQRFDRTLSSTSSSYTVSMWFKTVPVTTNFARGLFTLGPANNTDVAGVVFNTNDTLTFYGGNGTSSIVTTRTFRDTSAWYYFTYSVNSNNFTAYINGESLQTGTVRSLDTTSNGFRLGGWWGGYDLFRGYIADFYLIDGSALTPSSFTETNVETGQLIPKKYSGSFGTSGAHLLFDDNSGATATTLGKDSSGNGNNFTPINFSVAAGAGNDSLEDTPTNNFCTLNPLAGRGTGFLASTNGNLDFAIPAGGTQAWSSFQIPTSGKWYSEWVFTTVGSGAVGVGNVEKAQGSSAADQLNGINMLSGEIRVNDSATQSSLTAFGNNDIIGVKVDRDAGTVAFTINGSAVGNAENISSMNAPTDLVFRAYRNSSGGSTPTGSVNYGQRPFSNLPTGYKALNSANLPDPTIKLPNKHFDTVIYSGDGNSTRSITGVEFQPDWLWLKIRSASYNHKLYDAVRGAGSLKALCSSTTGAEGSDLDNSTYGFVNSFDANGFSVTKGSSSTSFTNGGSATYVAWNWNAGDTDSATYTVKVVSDSGNKYRFNNFGTSAVTLDLAEGGTYTFDGSDSSMSGHPFVIGTAANGSVYSTGVTYQLDGASVTYSAYTSGYASASTRKLIITVPASAPVLYYWCSIHSGMGGQINTNSTLGSSNFAGSRQATTKVNTTSGFSIISWTGTGSALTLGHGLGVAPKAYIVKARTGSSGCDWFVYHKEIAATHNLRLNNASASGASSDLFNNTEPTSTVLSIGDSSCINENNGTYITYAFSEVAGYSKFGSYTGNQNANGTFVFTGFRPAWVLVKGTWGGNWNLFDNKRPGINVTNDRLFPNLGDAETDGSPTDNQMDLLSNGFKLRGSNNDTNHSAGFIYLAFAEAPFKNSRAR